MANDEFGRGLTVDDLFVEAQKARDAGFENAALALELKTRELVTRRRRERLLNDPLNRNRVEQTEAEKSRSVQRREAVMRDEAPPESDGGRTLDAIEAINHEAVVGQEPTEGPLSMSPHPVLNKWADQQIPPTAEQLRESGARDAIKPLFMFMYDFDIGEATLKRDGAQAHVEFWPNGRREDAVQEFVLVQHASREIRIYHNGKLMPVINLCEAWQIAETAGGQLMIMRIHERDATGTGADRWPDRLAGVTE